MPVPDLACTPHSVQTACTTQAIACSLVCNQMKSSTPKHDVEDVTTSMAYTQSITTEQCPKGMYMEPRIYADLSLKVLQALPISSSELNLSNQIAIE